MKKRYTLRRYLLGATAARTGDEMSGSALLLAGLAATGSAASASALLAGTTIAAAVGGPFLGVLLDRAARPGPLLATALAGYALGLTAVLAGLGRIPLGWSVLIAVGTGLLGPALAGGWTAQLPRVLPAARLPRANALDAMTFNAAGLAGPALAGALAHLAGADVAVVLSAALICLALPAALRLPGAARAPKGAPKGEPAPALALPASPVPVPAAPSVPSASPAPSVLADLRAGLRATVRTRPLARATAVTAVSCAGEGMFVACAPLLGERFLGGAGQGAALLSGVAVTAFAANALLARRPGALRPDTVLAVTPLLLAAASALAALAGSAPSAAAVLTAAVVLAGLGEGPQLAALFAIRHRESPERLRGQVFTTGASLKLTGFAIGAGAAGPLALWSLPGALLTAACVQLLAALVGSFWRRGGPRPY